VTKRFLAIFYPAAEFLETNRITRVEGESFKSAGKVLVIRAGWRVYGKEANRMTRRHSRRCSRVKRSNQRR